MAAHTVITELEDDEPASKLDDQLDQLLSAHNDDAKKFLATIFNHLNRRTSFFKDPEASKVLARLLRDVKGPAAKIPAQSAPVAKAPVQSVTSTRDVSRPPASQQHKTFQLLLLLQMEHPASCHVSLCL